MLQNPPQVDIGQAAPSGLKLPLEVSFHARGWPAGNGGNGMTR